MEAAPRRALERRILAELRRFHRRQPLGEEIRLDALVARLRAAEARRPPSGHRGGGGGELDEQSVADAIDALAAGGQLTRRGRRIRLAGDEPGIDAATEARIDRFLDALRHGWPSPPRAETAAREAGIPAHLLADLRRTGRLVHLGPGIDLPADLYRAVAARIGARRAAGPLTVAGARDDLGCSRRLAAALLGSLPQD